VSAKALYFPYIKTPDDQWFTRVLLYWDAVGTIVPGNLEGDDRWVTPRMRALCDEGLLDFVRPVVSVADVPRFAEAFLTHLEADQRCKRDVANPSTSFASFEFISGSLAIWPRDSLPQDLRAQPMDPAGSSGSRWKSERPISSWLTWR
jgi:hypothetical protein